MTLSMTDLFRQYQAGVGNDARASRQFNPIKQANDYDLKGEYVRLWLPELKKVGDWQVHTPWRKLLPLICLYHDHD